MADQPMGHETEIILIEERLGGKQTRVNVEDEINRRLVRRWLILKGVPERKVWAASNYVLANAYEAGDRYVRKMIEGDDEDRNKRKFGSPRRGGGVKIELGGADEFKPGELGPLLNRDDEKEDKDRPIRPTPGSQAPIVDSAAIARAADAVITPRINAAKQELLRQVQSSQADSSLALKRYVNQEIERLGLGQNLSKEIEAIATKAAQAAAEQMLPRRIEIVRDGQIKQLPAEPRHYKFDTILKWLSMRQHVYIVGPKGTGKTHMFQQLADALGMRMLPIGQSLTKYDLSGYKSPTGDYVGTLMRDGIENGGLVCIDEGDMWAAAALGFLNSALAGNGFCSFPDKVVNVHEDFLVIIAANTFGTGADRQYMGRNPLDAASLDRFAFEIVDYDPDMERQIYGVSPWLEYVHKVRDACKKLNLPHLIPSMRAIQKGLRGYAAGIDPDSISGSSLWMGSAEDTINKIKNLAGQPPRRVTPVPTPGNGKGHIDLTQVEEAKKEFRFRVENGELVSAIRILREYKRQLPDADDSLVAAKSLAEQFRDGNISIEEVFAS